MPFAFLPESVFAFAGIPTCESTTLMGGEFFIASQMEGGPPARTGNAHSVWAPHGTYRCRGEDEWVSLAVRSDDEWVVFCRVAGLTAMSGNPAYATAAGPSPRSSLHAGRSLRS
jgi:benzylsuccinate CoA-transferase BbsF subunit